jgi:hypothetical protein
MTSHKISKSQYVRGLQCPKALWLYRHRKDLAPEITPEKQALFDTGHVVGELAMQYFGHGVEVTNEYWDIEGAVEATKSFITRGEDIIFEAMAIHPIDGGYSRIDILKRVGGTDEWDLIEVKSSTSVKDYHIDDMAFQYHVFNGAGYKIRKCFMMVLDNSYVRNGDIDPSQLLRLEEISGPVFAKQGEVEAVSGQLGYVLERKGEPEMSIGSRCFKPFECDYKPYCWVHVPDYSVYNVFQKSKAEEVSRHHGVTLEKLPDHIRPGGAKGLDVESYLNGDTLVDHANISGFLSQVQYPLYFLDYETLQSAIPMFDGTRSFQQIPFQFSVHIQESSGAELVHHEYLHKNRTDPRHAFADKLVELCGDSGTVLVYNQAFEIARNNELANDFPEHAAAIQSINARVLDLFVPFKKRWLYNPSQNSSASIKAVLPAFTDLSYDDLEIGHGGEAMRQYGAFMNGSLPESELPTLWDNLSEYCKQDTYAMVTLLGVLERVKDNE